MDTENGPAEEPCVVSSTFYQEFLKKKEQRKSDIEVQKQERALMRERKKKEKEEMTRRAHIDRNRARELKKLRKTEELMKTEY